MSPTTPAADRERADAAAADLAAHLDRYPDLAAALPGIERAAGSQAPVLLLGEAGSGRTTLARLIHRAGPRAGGPLVEVDAGVLPGTLVESELFGHRAGAFTGAADSAPGRVARAEGGSLVLDHVEELPLAIQPKLLRLLAERRYSPLGSEERIADVRFLALAADDLPRRVDAGAFREDLYYRLEVLAFRIPPLRRRRRDLEPLIEALLADLAARFSRPRPRLSATARHWMAEHSWPGNLRQLRNLLERELLLTDGPELDPPLPRGSEDEGPPRSLADLEQEQIRRVLAHTRGHQEKAAELLGISRKTLWQKRRKYGIP